MKFSGVNYVDSSINPTDGCQGCELWTDKGIRTCYAGRIHERYHGRGTFRTVIERPGRMAACRAWSDLRGTSRTGRPWMDGLPRIIFISDMSDAILAPFNYLMSEVISTVRATPQHLYLWLTKRATRMIDFAYYLEQFGGWPKNLVPGVSVTWPEETYQRVKTIKTYQFPVDPMISYEPAHGNPDILWDYIGGISWLTFGGPSGPGTRAADMDTAERVLKMCRASEVSFFMKQTGGGDRHDQLEDLPESLRVREYPNEFYL
jgi:protein gp37